MSKSSTRQKVTQLKEWLKTMQTNDTLLKNLVSFLKQITIKKQIIDMATKKVIKFYASWCGPCKIYGKTWDKVIPAYEDQVNFISVGSHFPKLGFWF